MTQSNSKLPIDIEQERETAEAHAELQQLVEAQGVKPFNFDQAFGEGAEGQSQEEIQQEVDEFLRMVRETRDMPSARSIE